MKTHLWPTLTVLLATFCSVAGGLEPPGPIVEIGVARIDITPKFPVRLSGYLGRTSEFSGVDQRLWAKAMAIGSDDAGVVVLVSVDNLGVGESVVEEVAGRLKKSVGLDRSRFVVASSHTHSAPCLTGVAPNIFGQTLPDDEQTRIDRYTRELTDNIERVSLDALKDRKIGRLSWAQGSVAFAANRRTRGGPVDHALPVLRVTDAGDRVRAILVNYACHCTTLKPEDNTCSGDWAGYAQEAIEKEYPGAVALTVVGCGADANPTRRLEPGAAADHGKAIANEINRLSASPDLWKALVGPPSTAFQRLTLPFDTPPDRKALEELVKKGGAAGYNASTQLARLDRGEPLQAELNYSTQAWAFGEGLVMVFLPGEVVVDYVLRIKDEFDAGRIWVTAYANDLPCYIPSERILREGGYEGGGAMVYYARPTRLKPGLEQIIIDAVHKVVPEGFRRNRGAEPSPPPPSPSPEEAVQAIQVKPGFKVELVASEPLVIDPVAIDFGADGRLWVCEMRDYPTGINGDWKPGGVIKVLQDTDGDGKFDKGTEFLRDLPFPTGVMEWRDGVLICAAPRILFAKDTNGDGKADVVETLFEGFATENYQARVNGLSYNLDNWVYGANGLIGGSIRGKATGGVIDIGGRDFRILPDNGLMEPATGLTQQGRVHDDWGNQFGGNNSLLIDHYPFPDHYARRNPRVAAPSPAVYLPREEDSTRVFPASETLDRYNHPESANRVTSACSPLIYRDDLLGESFRGNAFVCEPVHNLIRRIVLKPDGVSFAGTRAADEQDSEFLASTDHWFRPVQVLTGPDGGLWVVDMSRFVIEHPRWISPDRLATIDVRAGDRQGRIYRVVPIDRQPRLPANFLKMTDAELAEAMDSPNGTTRDLVQRLIVHRGGTGSKPTLERLARSATHPEARAQALGALDGIKGLSPETLRAALDDPSPGVRKLAVRLAEPFLDQDESIAGRVLGMVDEPEITVRLQLGLSLGEWDDPRAGQALSALAIRDSADSWVRAAVLSSAVRHAPEILAAVVGREGSNAFIEPLVATMAGSGDPATVHKALEILGTVGAGPPESWRLAAVARLLDSAGDPRLRNDPAVIGLVQKARGLADDPSQSPEARETALRLVARDPNQAADDSALLGRLLGTSQPLGVQRGAIEAIGRLPATLGTKAIVDRWSGLGPVVRSAALDLLLSRSESSEALLGAIERGSLGASTIDPTHRQQLIKSDAPSLRARALATFSGLAIGPRNAVLDRYRTAKGKASDLVNGRRVFEKVCAACHKLGELGHEVGPDLAALTDTSFEALLTAILDPNREVDARHAVYTAALKDGRVLNGLVVSETASGLTLKRQEGQTDVVLRVDLEELKTTGQSLMPEGMENDLTPSDVSDVIGFVARGQNLPREVPGNRPVLVSATTDGSVTLSASAAEIFGPNLTYETGTDNLGFWQSERDRASWTFRTEKAATYTVSMVWACAEESAGNRFLVRVGKNPLRGEVGSTGKATWANYQSIFVGETTLPAGNHRLEFLADGPPRQALLDLRAVVLTPRSEGVYRAVTP